VRGSILLGAAPNTLVIIISRSDAASMIRSDIVLIVDGYMGLIEGRLVAWSGRT
jgi:hypothetical protein